MKHYIFATLLLSLTAGSAAFALDEDPEALAEQDVQRSMSFFSFDLYRQLAKDAKPDENLFFSPASIYLALGMTAAGAAGNTESQMLTVLRLPPPSMADMYQPAGFRGLIANLGRKSEDYQLSIANRLWPEKTNFAMLPEFQRTLKENFLADMQPLDFRGAPQASRKTINAWVAERTKDKIQDLMPEDSITPMTRLVLTNAVYFKGSWVSAFEKEFTHDLPFLTKENQAGKKVPMMFREGDYSYYVGDGFRALSLPYRGGPQMIILLPDEIDGLPALEKSVTFGLLEKAVKGMTRKKVKLWLTKFRLEESFSLNETLIKMGMPDAFTANADFSKIAGTRDLYISTAVHKAFVNVNEEGTEAAAATGTVIEWRSAPRPQEAILFKTDRPFLFAIRDANTGVVLFLGRVAKP